jgi:hypothetical protein
MTKSRESAEKFHEFTADGRMHSKPRQNENLMHGIDQQIFDISLSEKDPLLRIGCGIGKSLGVSRA